MRSKAEKLPFAPGDAFHLASPGGGGFGDPLDRDPALVEADLNGGVVNLATAESVHGVVATVARTILDRPVYRIDRDRTQERRSAIASTPDPIT